MPQTIMSFFKGEEKHRSSKGVQDPASHQEGSRGPVDELAVPSLQDCGAQGKSETSAHHR